ASAGVNEIGLRIVGDAVPNRAATTQLPCIRRPGFRRFAHGRVFKGLRWIAWNGVEAPQPAARERVISIEEAALGVIAAAHADDYFPVRDARRHRDGVLILRPSDARLPHRLSR